MGEEEILTYIENEVKEIEKIIELDRDRHANILLKEELQVKQGILDLYKQEKEKNKELEKTIEQLEDTIVELSTTMEE